MKKINRIIPIILISVGAALFCFNILNFIVNHRYVGQGGYIIGASIGVFLFTLGISTRKWFQENRKT